MPSLLPSSNSLENIAVGRIWHIKSTTYKLLNCSATALFASRDHRRLFTFGSPVLIGDQDRRRNRDRGLGPDQNSYHQRKREPVQHFTTEQVQS